MFIPVAGGGCLILLGPSQNTVWKWSGNIQ